MALTPETIVSDAAAMIDDGVDAVYTPVFGGPLTVKCVFWPSSRIAIAEYGGVVTTGPECLVLTASCPDVRPGETLTISGEDYYVKTAHENEHGARRIELSKDPVK